MLCSEVFPYQRGAPGNERRRHAGATVEIVQRICRGRPPRGIRIPRSRRQDIAPGRHDIGFNTSVGCRAAAAKGHHAFGIIRHPIRRDRVGGIPETLLIGDTESGPVIFCRADCQAILGGTGRRDRLWINHAVGIEIHPFVAGSKADNAVSMLPDEFVDLKRVGIVSPITHCASPGIGVHTNAVIVVGRRNRSCKSSGNPPSPPALSNTDCSTNRAAGAVPLTAWPSTVELPSPRTEPATWVPCPFGSLALLGVRVRTISATRPVNALCTSVAEPLSNPVSATAIYLSCASQVSDQARMEDLH